MKLTLAYPEFGSYRSIKTRSVKSGGYTDKARLRGLKAKPTFTNRIWYYSSQRR